MGLTELEAEKSEGTGQHLLGIREGSSLHRDRAEGAAWHRASHMGTHT